ncbi:ATP-binding protein [Sphingomonas zeae]|uniref:ATP-binding protein n=1 Tax=Sphingomonas zeae TaxID=1646122 RepID=A0A7Y6EI96_9SPHN|nr:ATP-binding protein [Sphingomonas zeae]
MPALTPNIENRVRKLPKPSNATQSLQPLFEAVSNAMFAIEDEFDDRVSEGRIDISVSHLSDPAKITIEVADDGIGLDQERYGAFCTIDTDFKRSKGGKGVGRLFWLDAFDGITIESGYRDATEVQAAVVRVRPQ